MHYNTSKVFGGLTLAAVVTAAGATTVPPCESATGYIKQISQSWIFGQLLDGIDSLTVREESWDPARKVRVCATTEVMISGKKRNGRFSIAPSSVGTNGTHGALDVRVLNVPPLPQQRRE